ncbi:MAG: hypothetical protein WDM86_08420 [Rhizomicrobium sp.]
MRPRTDRTGAARAFLLAACMAASLVWPASAGEIRAFKFPVPTFDEDGGELDYEIDEDNAPPADGVIVYGWRPDMKMLLIQLRPNDPQSAVYISYAAVEMRDQATWDGRMRATGTLFCARGGNRTILAAGANPNQSTTGSKGFKNPC